MLIYVVAEPLITIQGYFFLHGLSLFDDVRVGKSGGEINYGRELLLNNYSK